MLGLIPGRRRRIRPGPSLLVGECITYTVADAPSVTEWLLARGADIINGPEWVAVIDLDTGIGAAAAPGAIIVHMAGRFAIIQGRTSWLRGLNAR